MFEDLVIIVLAGGLVLIGLALAVTVYALAKAHERAVNRAELAERLLAYRQPGSSWRVARSPLVRHRAGVR